MSSEDMQSHRFADPETVTQYPLEIPADSPAWDGLWASREEGLQAVIELGNLAAGDMIAPSLSIPGPDSPRYRFVLEASGKRYPLPSIPTRETDRGQPNPSDSKVRTAIDCYHLDKAVRDVRLVCQLSTTRTPERFLLTTCIRPAEMAVPAPGQLSDQRAVTPPARSQMLENPRIAGGICSPVSTAMVLGAHISGLETGPVIRGCFDPITRMYGMWPLAISCAARMGVIGAVELLADWGPVHACLAAGLPLVASIRFKAGELPGAPMPATGGHLVVVHGIEDGQVLVNDPAAPNHGSVSRHYPLEVFGRAWFRHRGATYILCP